MTLAKIGFFSGEIKMPADQIPENCIIYLARHADPDRSSRNIPYHTHPGPDLTELGLQQSQRLGAFFDQMGVKHILASPLNRAWQTAQIAAHTTGASVEMNLDLAEWRLDEVEKGVTERMARAFTAACVLASLRGPVAMISHGAPILSLVKHLGLEPAEIDRMRIYDSRNLIPVAGAFEIKRSSIQLVYVPQEMAKRVALANPLH